MVEEAKGKAIASMIVGIVSLVCGLFFSWIVGLIGGMVGLVLAVSCKKAGDKSGFMYAGIVCSIITLAFGIMGLFTMAFGIALLSALF